MSDPGEDKMKNDSHGENSDEDEGDLVDNKTSGRRFMTPRFGGSGGSKQKLRKGRKSGGEKSGYDSDGNRRINHDPAEPKIKEFLAGISPISNKDVGRIKPFRRLTAPGGV